MSEGDAVIGDAKRFHQRSSRRRRHRDLIGQSKQARPENTFDARFPARGCARGQACRVCAKKKCHTAKARSKKCDPEAGTKIAKMAVQGMEPAIPNQLPQTGIIKPQNESPARAPIWHFRQLW